MDQQSNGSMYVDTEVPAKVKRRRFTAAYKLRILEQADRCSELGEIGSLQEACRRGYDVLFVPLSKLLGHLHGGRADGTLDKRLAAYLRPDLLVLDDFGLRRLKAQETEDLYEVINARYEQGSILVTSNRDYNEWPEAFGDNPLLASAALDRLAHRAHLITITGRSYRAHDGPMALGKQVASN